MITINAADLGFLEHYLEQWPTQTRKSMSIALNRTVDRDGKKLIRQSIMDEVNFPPGYLDLPGRLEVGKYATPTDLKAQIRARDRSTTLTRFAAEGTPVSGGGSKVTTGVTVSVKRGGGGTFFKNAFLWRLPNGNVVFAERVKGGEPPSNAYRPYQVRNKRTGKPTGLYLLYGPSVEQAFVGVAQDVAPQLLDMVAAEFFRQMGFRGKV